MSNLNVGKLLVAVWLRAKNRLILGWAVNLFWGPLR